MSSLFKIADLSLQMVERESLCSTFWADGLFGFGEVFFALQGTAFSFQA